MPNYRVLLYPSYLVKTIYQHRVGDRRISTEQWSNKGDRGIQKRSEKKNCAKALCPPQIPFGPDWNRNRALALRDRDTSPDPLNGFIAVSQNIKFFYVMSHDPSDFGNYLLVTTA